jgi:hypothetical protein
MATIRITAIQRSNESSEHHQRNAKGEKKRGIREKVNKHGGKKHRSGDN